MRSSSNISNISSKLSCISRSNRTVIQKIRDSEAGGIQSVKSEQYFHGFIPTIQTTFLLKEIGEFLVRQTIKGDLKNSSREQFVVSIRLYESKYVPRDSEELYKQWVKKGRSEEHAIPGVIEETVYGGLAEKERDMYVLVEEGVGHFIMKYSRRARIFYMNKFGFTHSSGLIDYHLRHKQSVSPENPKAILRKSVKKEDWQYNHEQIERVKRLGEGAFGEVFMGRLRLGLIKEADVAVKSVFGTVTAEEIEKLFEEAMLMQRLQHPNVVRFFGVASNDDPVMIVMELCTGGSVLDAVRLCRKKEADKPAPTISKKIEYVRGSALGLQYLQSKGIVHRDLAARNTLIGKGDRAKISDFGLSITGGARKEKVLKKMPTRYLAPQTLRNAYFDSTTDMWSFGIMIYEVFHDGPEELYPQFESAKDVKNFVIGGSRLGIQDGFEYPQIMWETTKRCWSASSELRISIDELINIIEDEDYRQHGRCSIQRLFKRKWLNVAMAPPCADGWKCDENDIKIDKEEDAKVKQHYKKVAGDERKKLEKIGAKKAANGKKKLAESQTSKTSENEKQLKK